MELREASSRRRPGRYREYDGPTGAERPTFVHEDPTFDPDLADHCAFPSLDTSHAGPGPSAVWKERKRLAAAAAKHPVIVIEGDGDGDSDADDLSSSTSPSPDRTGGDRLLLSVSRQVAQATTDDDGDIVIEGVSRLLSAVIIRRPRSPVPQRQAKTVSLARKAPLHLFGEPAPLAPTEPGDGKFMIRDIGRRYPNWPELTDGVKYVIIHDMTKNGMSFMRACNRLRLVGGKVAEMIELVAREEGKMQRNDEAIAQVGNNQPVDDTQAHAPPREDLVTDSLSGSEIRKGKAFLNFMGLKDVADNLGFFQGSMGQDYHIPLNHFTEDGWENLGPHFRNGCPDEVRAMWKADREAKKANPPAMSDSELHVKMDAPPGTVNPMNLSKPFVPEVTGDGLHPDNYLEKLPDGTHFNFKDGTVVEDREELLANITPAFQIPLEDIPLPSIEHAEFDFEKLPVDGAELLDTDPIWDLLNLPEDEPNEQAGSVTEVWFQPSGSQQRVAPSSKLSPTPQWTTSDADDRLPGFETQIEPPRRESSAARSESPREQFPTIDARFLARNSPLRTSLRVPPEEEPPTIDPHLLTSNLTVRERSPTVVKEVDDILSRYQHVLKSSPPPKKTSRQSARLRPGSEGPFGLDPPQDLPEPSTSQKKKKQKNVQFEDDEYEDSDGEYLEPAKKKCSPRGQKTQKAPTKAEPVRSSGRKKQTIGSSPALEVSPAPRSTRRGSVFDYIPATPAVKKTSKEDAVVEPAQGVAVRSRVAELQAQGRKDKKTTSVSEQPANLTPSDARDKTTKKSRAPETSSPATFAPVTTGLGTPVSSDPPEPGSAPVSLPRASRTQGSNRQSTVSSLSSPMVHPNQQSDAFSTNQPPNVPATSSATSSPGSAPHAARKRKGYDSTGVNPEGVKPAKKPRATRKTEDVEPFTRQSHTPIPIPVVPNFLSSVGSGAAVSLRDTAERYRHAAELAADSSSSGLASQNMANREDTRGMPPPSRAEFEIIKSREMQKAVFLSSLEREVGQDDPVLLNPEAFGISAGFMPGRRRASAIAASGTSANPSEPVVNPGTTTTSNDPISRLNLAPAPSTMSLPTMGPSASTSQTPSLSANESSPAMNPAPTPQPQHGYSRSQQRYRAGLAAQRTNPPSGSADNAALYLPVPGLGKAQAMPEKTDETTQPVAGNAPAHFGKTAQTKPQVRAPRTTMLTPKDPAMASDPTQALVSGTSMLMPQGTANTSAPAPMTGAPANTLDPTTLTMRPAANPRPVGNLNNLLPLGWAAQQSQQTSQQGVQQSQSSTQNTSDPDESMPIDPRLLEPNP